MINFLFFLKERNGVMIFKVKKRKCLYFIMKMCIWFNIIIERTHLIYCLLQNIVTYFANSSSLHHFFSI